MSLFDHLRPSKKRESDQDPVHGEEDVLTPAPPDRLEAEDLIGPDSYETPAQMRSRVSESVLESLAEGIAAPLTHLLVQARLALVDGSHVTAEQLHGTIRRLVEALADHGVLVFAEIGEEVAFDPNLHLPIGLSVPPVGARCVVKATGVKVSSGKVVRRAGVERL